jgi:hypothetical protein
VGQYTTFAAEVSIIQILTYLLILVIEVAKIKKEEQKTKEISEGSVMFWSTQWRLQLQDKFEHALSKKVSRFFFFF